jgi:hypothetical protein
MLFPRFFDASAGPKDGDGQANIKSRAGAAGK